MSIRSRIPVAVLRPIRNEDGATLIFFALMVMVLLGTFALAVDVGSSLNARSEAQRAADAGALAGGGLFIDQKLAHQTGAFISTLAPDTALAFASSNTVGWANADSIRPTVWQAADGAWHVGVEVFGKAPLFFAPFLGTISLPVYAYAEARAGGADGTDCVKPFALPDLWFSQQVANAGGTQVYDPAHEALWRYNPAAGDRYKRWDGSYTDPTVTGYGGTMRDGIAAPHTGGSYFNDNGRLMTIKSASPNNPNSSAEIAINIVPGIFLPIDMGGATEPIPGVNCNFSGGGGGAQYRRNICRCNQTVVRIGDEFSVENGNMVGPTSQGAEPLLALAAEPRTLTWVPTNGGQVIDEHGNVVTSSSRIVKVALYDPAEAVKPGKIKIQVNNIGLFFIEGFPPGCNNNCPLVGRFMMYAQGTGIGSGTTFRSLQLVK